jgi:iron complex outermembrane receptor protein
MNYADWQWKKRKLAVRQRLNLDFQRATHHSLPEKVQRLRYGSYSEGFYEAFPFLKFTAAARQELFDDSAYFFLPSFTLNYQPLAAAEWQLSASWTKNIRYPTLNDWYWQSGGNPELKVEESHSLDLTSIYEWQIGSKSLLAGEVSYFRSNIINYIQWRPGNYGIWQAINVGKVEIEGMEAQVDISSKGQLKQNYSLLYTYTASRNMTTMHEQDASYNKQLIYIPEHQFKLNARWGYKKFTLGLSHLFMGARYLTSDNLDYLPYYQLTDGSITYDLQVKEQPFKIGLSVMNIFDTEYNAIAWRPMPGRNYLLTLAFTL